MLPLEALKFLINTINNASFNLPLGQANNLTQQINEASVIIQDALIPKEEKSDDKG